jgi:hypothetical protein
LKAISLYEAANTVQELGKALGVSIRATPVKMPKGWLACVIALRPDGSIDKKRSCILKEHGHLTQ